MKCDGSLVTVKSSGQINAGFRRELEHAATLRLMVMSVYRENRSSSIRYVGAVSNTCKEFLIYWKSHSWPITKWWFSKRWSIRMLMYCSIHQYGGREPAVSFFTVDSSNCRPICLDCEQRLRSIWLTDRKFVFYSMDEGMVRQLLSEWYTFLSDHLWCQNTLTGALIKVKDVSNGRVLL